MLGLLMPIAYAKQATKAAQKDAGKKEFTFHGKVEKIDPKTKMVTINGEKVEGWMAAMIMAYPVDKEEVLKQVKVGDRITAKVYAGDMVLHDVHVVPPTPENKSEKSAPKK
jgi:Cu/Ag efflux protein CusF